MSCIGGNKTEIGNFFIRIALKNSRIFAGAFFCFSGFLFFLVVQTGNPILETFDLLFVQVVRHPEFFVSDLNCCRGVSRVAADFAVVRILRDGLEERVSDVERLLRVVGAKEHFHNVSGDFAVGEGFSEEFADLCARRFFLELARVDYVAHNLFTDDWRSFNLRALFGLNEIDFARRRFGRHRRDFACRFRGLGRFALNFALSRLSPSFLSVPFFVQEVLFILWAYINAQRRKLDGKRDFFIRIWLEFD